MCTAVLYVVISPYFSGKYLSFCTQCSAARCALAIKGDILPHSSLMKRRKLIIMPHSNLVQFLIVTLWLLSTQVFLVEQQRSGAHQHCKQNKLHQSLVHTIGKIKSVGNRCKYQGGPPCQKFKSVYFLLIFWFPMKSCTTDSNFINVG